MRPWMKIGFQMVDNLIGQVDTTPSTETPQSIETASFAQDAFDKPQGQKSAPAKESIPRIVSAPQ